MEDQKRIDDIYQYTHNPTHINKNGYCKDISLEDVKFLYDCGISYRKICDILNCTHHDVTKYMKQLGLERTQKQRTKVRNNTYMERYGCNISQLQETKDKVKQTNFERYGDWYQATDAAKQKSKEINLQKYGVDNYSKTPEFKQLIHAKASQIREKMNDTLLQRYGEHWGTNSTILDKRKQTNLKKYGCEWTSQNPDVKNHIIQSNLQKYGHEWATQSDEIKIKTYKTRKRNKTFRQSKQENLVYTKLCTKFNVIRQYKSVLYPFYCDFYIPELNLFIEYQGYWMHGKQKYDCFNGQHLQKVQSWVEKSKQKSHNPRIKKVYEYAIKTWTITDPLKRQIAKENNLNWIEFFNIQQFDEWFTTL